MNRRVFALGFLSGAAALSFNPGAARVPAEVKPAWNVAADNCGSAKRDSLPLEFRPETFEAECGYPRHYATK